MFKQLLTIPLFLATLSIFAELPAIPKDPIGVKKELLFSDDFQAKELNPAWKSVVPTFTLANQALQGTQTRVNAPAADGKPAVVGHAAIVGNDIPTSDSIIETKICFMGATALSVEFDDRKFTGSHYGHICRVVVTLKDVTLRDEKEGSMRNDIYEMKDPSQKDAKAKLLVGKSATFPNKLEAEKWYTLQLETIGDQMRASIDGKPVAYLKSPGIAHATKSKIELGCAGKNGLFDEIKVWNAEAGK